MPTSVGYGAAFEGVAALLGMLTSCAPGIGVVNIDNGFGAAALAHKIVVVGVSGPRRVAYVDMIGGAAGDMLLAAFLDAGLDRDALERALRTVVPDGWTLAPARTVKRGIAATFAGLVVPGEDGDAEHHDHDHAHHHDRGGERGAAHGTRTLADVLDVVARSGLTVRQRDRASAVYRRLADAEAHTHGTAAEHVRFHEVGQVDAILDVAATCVALDLLEIDELRCSPFPVGHGAIAMEHGRYPNPPPAVAHLLVGWPTRALDVAGELVTPTAAAILTTLAKPGRADMTIERIGYGAGRSDFSVPNVTRVLIGTAAAAAARRRRRRRRARSEHRRHVAAALRAGDGAALRGRRARRVAHAHRDEERASRRSRCRRWRRRATRTRSRA